MAHITFEQFLHHTNAEEIIVKKMKEAGPRIYQLNYDRRLKYCIELYKKFYDAKLRNTVLDYGLVLKPMPNSFKAKFLQFTNKNNNEREYNSSDTTEKKSEKKKKTKSPPLEDKYKDDLPSTSSAFLHKPRFISPPEKNKSQTKSKLKPVSQKQPNSKQGMSSSKTYKIPTKSAPKKRKSLEKPKSSHKSPKITSYFNSNALNTNVDEPPIHEGYIKLRKRISDPPNENIEIGEPQTKRPKISPVKKIDTKKEPEIKNSKIGPLSSKKNSKDRNSKDKTKKGNKCEGKKNTRTMRLYSDDFVSDDCDINTNNSIVNLTSEDSREHIPHASSDKKFANYSSPSKSALPKRNRIEDYGKTSNNIAKEISPEKEKKHKNGFTKNEIEQWIMDGQKALEDYNKTSCTAESHDRHYYFREDICVDYKLQKIKTHPDEVKKYIKYWLKFEIQMRKGINLEATVVSETSRAKILSTFNQMTHDDFKNLINAHRYISHWSSLGKSIDELEQNLKNHYTAFIRKEKSWPEVHIELVKLQSYLYSKGIKGLIPLKNIPPRVLSFDEVLEKTNIKECMSLSCNIPPESYTELLNLCKKEYEKCCCKGVWTEELKFNDKEEEGGGSSQEMSIELFTEPSMPMSPLKVTLDSGNIPKNVVSKEVPVLQNVDNSGSSNNVTKELPSNERNEFGDDSKNSTKNSSTIKKKKSRRCGPKSRRKNLSISDDELETQINQICGDDEQPVVKNTIEPMVPIDTQELNRILAHSQTQQLSCVMGKDVPRSKKKKSAAIAVRIDSKTHSLGKVVDNNQRDVSEQPHDSLIKTKQTSDVTSVSPTKRDNLITPSPNLFAYSDETNAKCSNIQVTNETTKTPPNNISNKKPLKSSEMDGVMLNPNVKSTDKHPNSPEKDNLIPLSPNLFQSSGESYSKCVDSHLIEVQTQESVYVPCEANIDFHTEQNNFSISINEVSESEDPFGETIANQEETVVIRLYPSYVEGNIEKSSENAQVSFSELNIPEESTSVTENLESNQVAEIVMENIFYSKETMVSKQLSLACKAVSVEPLETSSSHHTDLYELNASEKSISIAGNLDSNDAAEKMTENTKDSEETIVLKQMLLTVPVESPETTNNSKQKNSICSTERSSNPSYETSDIAECMNTNLEHAPHHKTAAINLPETDYNKEKENALTRSQSIEPTIIDVNDVAVNLAKTVENANKKLRKENLQSIQPEETPSISSACSQNPLKHQNDDMNAAKLTSNHNTISNKNAKKKVNNIETDVNSSAESLRNVKVVVKREIFSQSFSQYDDDVQIIEIPQSEAMVIEDEETAPELLEALLCSSPKRAPMTIVHTSISIVTPSSIYLDNFPQAQQFPSNFDLTQSQSNLNHTSNVSTNASSDKVNFQNVNKSADLETTTNSTNNICDPSNCHKFKTPHNQAANLNCSTNLKKSPSSSEAPKTKSRKKTSDRKRKLVENKPSCSTKSKDDRPLSEEMSEVSYVSIAPQNIPSEIELTQASSKSGETATDIRKTKMVAIRSKANQQNKKSRDNTQESGVSMMVCISDSFDETNKTCINLEQPTNIEENIKTEECLKFNMIQDSSPPDQRRDVEIIENSKDNPGKGLSWDDILEATKELKCVFDELSGIDEENVECKEEEQQLFVILEDSLDRSSDVQLLEESTEDDIGIDVSVEIPSNNDLVEVCEEHDREDDECLSNPSRDIAQNEVGASGDNDFINSNVIQMEVSKDKKLSNENKNGYKEALDYDEPTLHYSKGNLNIIELQKENNTVENAISSVVLSANDSGDVEILEESEEDDDIALDCVASLSQPSRVIHNLSKSIAQNEGKETEFVNKLKDSLREEDTISNERTVEGPIYHILVSDTNSFKTFNFDKSNAETCGGAEEQLVDNEYIKGSIKPIKACKVRIPKVNTLKAIETNHSKTSLSTALSPEEVQTYGKGPIKGAKCQLAMGYEELLLSKEDCQSSNMVPHPEGSNLVIQSPTEVNEDESVVEGLLSKDTVSNKIFISIPHDLDPMDNSTAQNLNIPCKDPSRKELDVVQEKSCSNSTKSISKHASEPIQIPVAETCQRNETSSTAVISKKLENTTVGDQSSDLQSVAEYVSTKQGIESDKSKTLIQKDVFGTLTVELCKSSETSEDLTTRISVSGRLKTNETDVAKNIDETTLSTKTSQDHDKSEKQASSEIFPGPSEATNKLKNTSDYVHENSENEIQEHVLKASAEILPSPSRVINKAPNTSEDETYSQSFGKKDNLNAIAITTSTQEELPVSEHKENDEENYLAPETSVSSSVEFIDFSLYYKSSDDENCNQNDNSKKKKKFSHTLNFKETSNSKQNTADTSKTINYANNEELLKSLNEGSECVLPMKIPSTIEARSTEIPKVSEASTLTLNSKIIFNRNETDSSCNKSFSAVPRNSKVIINLNKSYDSTNSNNSKTTIPAESLPKTIFEHRNAQAALCENKSSNSSTVELVESIDKGDFGTTRKLSKDCLQSEAFKENITSTLNIDCVLNENNSQASIDTKQSLDEDQGLSSVERNQCGFIKHSKNIKEAVEQVIKIKRNVIKNKRRRTISEQQKPVSDSFKAFSFSQPSEVHHSENPEKSPHYSEVPEKCPHHPEVPQISPKSDSQRLFQESSQQTTKITTNSVEPIISTKLKTVTLQGFILTASLQNIQTRNEDFVEVPIMIEKRLLNILPPMAAISESIRTNLAQQKHAVKLNVELKVDAQQLVNIEDPIPMSRDELKSPPIPIISCDETGSRKPEEKVTAQDNAERNKSPKKLPNRLGYKAKTKIPQPSTSKKKTTPKKSSKLPDFVQQKTHAFSSIPLKPCNKPPKSKPPSLLTVEECDYLIEDASQPIATTTASQILGTDCTYFENSELLRNLDEICIPHHPEVPELQIEQLPPQVPTSTPTTCKVINLIPIILSEGVTARKVWQVNLQWKSQKAMSIEVRFSVNRRSMTVCDESAKLLFTFTPEVWSDVHRVLREINHFEYKRRALKNQLKTTSLHKVLRQLFDSSTQVVDVKLINDNYNPYTICEKTIPVYRKPFQCLTKGIAPDILSKMKFLKEKLQHNNCEMN